jgi:hypothetical protein
MIYVRIDLWPHGDRSRARLLGEAKIANDAQRTIAGGGGEGAYNVTLSKWSDPPRVWKRGRVRPSTATSADRGTCSGCAGDILGRQLVHRERA